MVVAVVLNVLVVGPYSLGDAMPDTAAESFMVYWGVMFFLYLLSAICWMLLVGMRVGAWVGEAVLLILCGLLVVANWVVLMLILMSI